MDKQTQKKVTLFFLDQLKSRIGKTEAISMNLLIHRIEDQRFKITPEQGRKIIYDLRNQYGLPICSNRNGYFCAKEIEDVDENIASLEKRIKKQERTINSLKKIRTRWTTTKK